MSEQAETPQAERDVRELERDSRAVLTDAVTDALVREGIALLALAVVLLALDPRVRIWIQGRIRQLRWQLGDARKAAEEHAVAVLRKDISDFEHASKKASGQDGGCGCGQ